MELRKQTVMKLFLCLCFILLLFSSSLLSPLFLPPSKWVPHQLVLSPSISPPLVLTSPPQLHPPSAIDISFPSTSLPAGDIHHNSSSCSSAHLACCYPTLSASLFSSYSLPDPRSLSDPFTKTHSISSFEFESAISALQAHKYHLFGNALTTSDVFFLSSNSSFTLFTPRDSALFSLDMASSTSNYVNSLQCHAALGRFTISDLLALRNGSTIGALMPGRDLLIGHEMNDGVDVSIDGVRIVVSSVFNWEDLTVHGLDGILRLKRRKKNLDTRVKESGSTVLDQHPPTNSPIKSSASKSSSSNTNAPRISSVSTRMSPSVSPESRNPPSIAPFKEALKPFDKMPDSKSMANTVTFSLSSSINTLSLININYSQLFVNLLTSAIIILSLLMPTSYDNFSFNTSHLKFDDSNHEMVKSLSASYNTFIIGIPDVFISSIINLKITLSWLSTNTTLFFFKTKIVTVKFNNKTFFDNIDTFILVIPTFGIVAAIRSSLHPSLFAIDFISVHFLFDELDFTLHKSNKISLSIVTFFSLISQPDNNLHHVISSRIRNLEFDILSSTIVFSLLVPTSYNYDNKIIFDNINTSIFIIPTSGTVATIRSSLHSSLFAINHILVHFLFDKLNFAPHESISISRYTFTLSSLIAQLNDYRHKVIHYHLQNANVGILSSPHTALILTSKISFDNTSFNFTRDKYSHFVTIGSIYDLEDKVDFESVGMIGYQYGLHILCKNVN